MGTTMKKTRFAALLLTGKTAAFPLLINQAKADVTPSYQEVLGTSSTDLRVIELPLNTAVKLQSVSLDSNYGSSAYSAILCNNQLTAQNTSFNFVVTGVAQGETVYLAAASSKNDAANTALDSRLTIGTQGLKIIGSIQTGSAAAGTTPARLAVNFTVSTTDIQNLSTGGKVYVQAVTVPSGSGALSTWRYSELDEIRVGNCTTTSYGTSVY